MFLWVLNTLHKQSLSSPNPKTKNNRPNTHAHTHARIHTHIISPKVIIVKVRMTVVKNQGRNHRIVGVVKSSWGFFQFCVLSRLAESAEWYMYCSIAYVVSESTEQDWTQYWLLGYSASYRPPTRICIFRLGFSATFNASHCLLIPLIYNSLSLKILWETVSNASVKFRQIIFMVLPLFARLLKKLIRLFKRDFPLVNP